MVKNLQEKTFPNVLGYFEKQASTNGASEGWIFGKVMNDCCCSYLTSDVSRHISNLLRPAQCQNIYMFFFVPFPPSHHIHTVDVCRLLLLHCTGEHAQADAHPSG